MFLEKHDLYTAIIKEHLAEITNDTENAVPDAIEATIIEMSGYLRQYNCDAIFRLSGKKRNKLLLTIARDIAVYNIIVICQAGQDYEMREDRYKLAIKRLKEIRDGLFDIDLPLAEQKIEEEIYFHRSQPKRRNYYR